MKKNLTLSLIVALILAPFSSLGSFNAANAQGINLITNPSLETASSIDPTLPQGWQQGGWGTNTAKFTYPVAGQDGLRGAQVDVTSYTNGDAKWYFDDVPVSGSTKYYFNDNYKSTVPTEVVAQITDTAGLHNYVDLGSVPASSTWAQTSLSLTTPASAKSVTFFHTIGAVGTLQVDNYYFSATPLNPPPPPAAISVALTSPSAGATIVGTAAVAANASGGTGIAGVQFKLDGVNLGAEDTTAPYSLSWDSTQTANGAHSLTAVARDGSNTVASSAAVSVTVTNNTAPLPPSGIVPNGSVEQISATDPTIPASWGIGGWGTNSAAFSYLNTGHSGNHSVKTQVTSYTSGDAKWYFAPQTAVPNQTYSFSDYYQSNIPTEVVAAISLSNGTTAYQSLGVVPASAGWALLTKKFTTPVNTTSVTVFQVVAGVGYLITDDYSLSVYTPLPFKRGIVSLTFDDGWGSQYKNAFPILKQNNVPATFYLISQYTGASLYMTSTQIKALQSAGEELADHSATHAHLTTLTPSQLTSELSGSQQQLRTAFGGTFTNFASPYGEYNDAVLTEVKKSFGSHRSTDVGFNSRDDFDAYNIRVQNIDINTSQAQLDGWITSAANNKTWLVLVYHEVGANSGGGIYHTTTTQLQGALTSIKSHALTALTLQQALTELKPQLTP